MNRKYIIIYFLIKIIEMKKNDLNISLFIKEDMIEYRKKK